MHALIVLCGTMHVVHLCIHIVAHDNDYYIRAVRTPLLLDYNMHADYLYCQHARLM